MSSTSAHEGSNTVAEFYRIAQEGDIDGAFAMMAPDFVARIPPCLPWGGVHKSPDEFKAAVHAHLAGVLDIGSIKLTRIYGEGDNVYALMSALTGDGEQVEMAEDWVLKDGKLQNVQVFYHDPFPAINYAKKLRGEA